VSDAHVPDPGEGDWYLIRAASVCGSGTYDDGTEDASRDPGLAASANACP